MSGGSRRVILLVYGQPGHGKSYLAEKLTTEHSFAALSVDEAYVEFIRVHCPILYFEALQYYVPLSLTQIATLGENKASPTSTTR